MQATRNGTYISQSDAARPSSTALNFAGRYWVNAVALALGDVTALGLSLAIAAGLWRLPAGSGVPAHGYVLFVLVGWLLGAARGRLLPGWGLSPSSELERLFKLTLGIAVLTAGALVLTGQAQQLSHLSVVTALLLPLPAVFTGRALVRLALRRAGWWGVPAVVYGAGAAIRTTVMNLQAFPTYGYRPVAIFDPREELDGDVVCGVPITSRVPQTAVAPVAIMSASDGLDDLGKLLTGPLSPYATVIVLPDLFDTSSTRIASYDFGGVMGFSASKAQPGWAAQAVKRAIDLGLVVLSAPFWVPLCALLAALIWAGDRRSPLFRQQRVGRLGRTFTTWKFRTMVPDAEAVLQRKLAENPELRREWETSFKLRRDPRITRIGTVLRKTSLDELPQLINVLRGEMSLVGPRPLPAYHHEQLSRDSQYLRLRVLPGMTGLWQVSGRSEAGNEGLERYDPYYVRNWSIWLDLLIVLRTVRVVVLGSGAY